MHQRLKKTLFVLFIQIFGPIHQGGCPAHPQGSPDRGANAPEVEQQVAQAEADQAGGKS